MGWIVALGLGCTEPPPTAPGPLDPDDPRHYARTCAEALGPIPGFDCDTEATAIPITVDGATVEHTPELCDRPNLLEQSCVPGSRVGRKVGERPGVSFVYICRALYEDDEVPFDDVAMIGYDADSGATCFFQGLPEAPITQIPSPMDDTTGFWANAADTANAACAVCHLPDPFLHSPWVDQVRDPDDPAQPLVPNLPGFSPYFVAGGPEFDGWRLEHFALPGNPCGACHPIGRTATILEAVRAHGPLTESARAWPSAPWMPPDFAGTEQQWQETYGPAIVEIERCLRRTATDPEICDPTPLPR